MKKLFVLMGLVMGICSVQADNLFQSTNPFPQTMPQDMNNIYEARPATLQDEAKKAKKSWFRKGDNLKKQDEKIPEQYRIPVYPVQYEGASSNGSFYMFSTGQ